MSQKCNASQVNSMYSCTVYTVHTRRLCDMHYECMLFYWSQPYKPQNHKHTTVLGHQNSNQLGLTFIFTIEKCIHEPIALHFMAHFNGNGDAPSSYQQQMPPPALKPLEFTWHKKEHPSLSLSCLHRILL